MMRALEDLNQPVSRTDGMSRHVPPHLDGRHVRVGMQVPIPVVKRVHMDILASGDGRTEGLLQRGLRFCDVSAVVGRRECGPCTEAGAAPSR